MRSYPDVSVLLASLLDEPSTDIALELLAGPDITLVTSEWALTEMAPALGIKQRAGHILHADRDRVLANARKLTVDSFDFHAVTAAHCRVATSLIERSPAPLRGGDALNLAIAADAGATLWTLDRRMAEAGQALYLDARLLA